MLSDLKVSTSAPHLGLAENVEVTEIDRIFAELRASNEELVQTGGVEAVEQRLFADFRYSGQVHELTIPILSGNGHVTQDDWHRAVESFHISHEQLYTFRLAHKPVELITLRLDLVGMRAKLDWRYDRADAEGEPRPKAHREAWIPDTDGTYAPCLTPIYDGSRIQAGQAVTGPAVIEEAEHHDRAPRRRPRVARRPRYLPDLDRRGGIVRDMVERAAADLASEMPWPSNPMVAVGRDDGRPILVSDPSRAPSLAASAAYLSNFFDDLQPGDAIISNDPFVGASHVTDFTLVRRARRSTALARVRLPDIGGFEFGGLAPQSFDTWGEGARFPALRVSVAGRPRHEALNLVALNSRTPALLRMGLGAMERVAAGLSDAFDDWDEDGEETLFSAASAGRLALAELTAGSYRAEAPVESPVPGKPPVVRVELTIGSERPRLSLAGSSRQLEAPLNSPPGHTLDCCLCALADAVPSFPLAPGALDSLEIDTGESTITGATRAGDHRTGALFHCASDTTSSGCRRATGGRSGDQSRQLVGGRRPRRLRDSGRPRHLAARGSAQRAPWQTSRARLPREPLRRTTPSPPKSSGTPWKPFARS